MLDLKKLELKLDEALAKETTESLTKWLLEKRAKSYIAYLGEGEIELNKPIISQILLESTDIEINVKVSEINFTNYVMAA